MTRYQRYFFISGDFEEAYNELIVDKGHFFARHWFWFQTICCLPKYIANQLYWSMAMFNNYFKIVLRNLGKYKGHSFINIFGLAVGMGCCILILLWVRDELSYDRFHENAEKLYRITEHQYNSSGDYFPVAVTPWPLAEALKQDFPEIIESARLRILSGVLVSYNEKKFYENDVVAVDPSFLNMFSFPLIKGDIGTALTEPLKLLISESAAARYFGDEDPIGKALTYNNAIDIEISGVLKKRPPQLSSTIRLSGAVRIDLAYVRLDGELVHKQLYHLCATR